MDLHGGNIYRLQREGKDNLLDYSSNINPLGVPEKFKEKVINSFHILEKYPDPEYVELRENIAKYNGVKLENIVVGNGATEILFLHMKAMKPKRTLIVAPAFAEYKRALDTIESEILYYPLLEENSWNLDVENFLKELPQCDLVVICNPNNPTGSFIPLEKIKRINSEFEKRGIKLFIDEAFIEFVEDWENQTAILLESKNIFIMRALTKFFAVPGVRLGYGITFDSKVLKKMESYKEPWSVNSFAELAGKTMLWDSEYIETTEKWIAEEKKWFFEESQKIENIRTYKTNVNFILVKLLKYNSSYVREKMIEKGVIVRDASNFQYLNESYIRLAIKNRENNIKVLKALEEVMR